MGEGKGREVEYEDWDKVCKACEKEFKLINDTRVSMGIAEICQKITYKKAVEERDKLPKPVEKKEIPTGTN